MRSPRVLLVGAGSTGVMVDLDPLSIDARLTRKSNDPRPRDRSDELIAG
jgi:hypothetical protein